MRWILASLRRLRIERAATLGIVGLVLVTALLFALAPRVLDVVSDRALRDQVAAARASERSIQLIQHDRIADISDDAADSFEAIDERGEELVERLPDAVRDLIVDDGVTIVTPRYRIYPEADEPEHIRFRFEPGVEAHISLVAGRMPTDATREVDDVGPDETDGALAFEVLVSRETARLYHLDIGASRELGIDFADPLVGRGVAVEGVVIDVVGIYEVNDPGEDYWLDDTLLARPSIRWLGGDSRAQDADVIVATAAYPKLLRATAESHNPLRYTWRHYLDPERLDSATVTGVLLELRRAQATYPSANVTFGQDTAMRSSMLPLIERQRSGWVAAESILTVVGIGPAAVAAAALGLVVLLAAGRRRSTMALSRARGASIGQVVASVAAEGLLLSVPAVALAAALAIWLVPSGAALVTVAAAAAVALAVVVTVVATSVPGSGSMLRGPSRDGGWRRVGARRLVLEAGVVVLAVGGAYLLRERGIRGTSATGQLEAADPLIAAVPALAGIAAALVAVRLYPLPIRLLAWLAALGRGLVPVLAMRRSIHAGTSAPVLIVLLATVAIGAFSASALVHIDRSAELVAWQEVGAAYRVNSPGGSFPGDFEPAGLPAVERAADVFRVAIPIGLNGPRHEFIALDLDDYDAVVAGTPADPDLPLDLHGAGPGLGGPIPAVISRGLTSRPDGVELGEVFQITVEGYTFQLQATEVRDAFPGVDARFNFVITAADQLRTAAPNVPLVPSASLLRAPDDAAEQIAQAVAEELPGAGVDGRMALTTALRQAPAVEAIRAGIGASAAVSALYAALAVAAALALAGILRAIEVAHLRTLGLTRREALALVVIEHGPTVVVAFGIGLAFGLGLFALLRPGLGLDGLVGSAVDIPVGIDVTQLGIIVVAMVGIVVVGMSLGAWFQRNAAPVAAVRRGFE